MSSLVEFRKLYKDEYLKKTGVRLGFMSAFSRACVLAMKDIPTINAGIEGPSGGDTIVYHDYVDISVAVATEKGLTTPVVRNVESMNLIEIEAAIADLGKKARDNKLTIEDLAGGTFTISNGGVFGSLMSTPIINPPQSAVLGLHAIFNRAVPIDGKIEIRPVSREGPHSMPSLTDKWIDDEHHSDLRSSLDRWKRSRNVSGEGEGVHSRSSPHASGLRYSI